MEPLPIVNAANGEPPPRLTRRTAKPGSVSKEQEQEREEGAHLCEMGSGFYSLVAGPLRSQGRVCVTRVCEARGALAHACGVACGGRARGVLW